MPWECVPYLSALEVCSRQGAIQIKFTVYLYWYVHTAKNQRCTVSVTLHMLSSQQWISCIPQHAIQQALHTIQHVLLTYHHCQNQHSSSTDHFLVSSSWTCFSRSRNTSPIRQSHLRSQLHIHDTVRWWHAGFWHAFKSQLSLTADVKIRSYIGCQKQMAPRFCQHPIR